MAERTGPTLTANKIAMSKALGAAFLNHQVEQLEKSVANNPSAGNWRERKYGSANTVTTHISTSPKRGNYIPANKTMNRRKAGSISRDGDPPRTPQSKERNQVNEGIPRRLSNENKYEKDADIVIVDASVLVHGMDHLKRWGRNGREEIVIVPLEALNTLDLLKKGTSSLAQRARAASRILEAQVGPNPRIRVQQDDAFMLWDQIKFDTGVESTETDKNASPEWVRRTICCARWEIENAGKTLPDKNAPISVVLAVCTTANQSPLVSTVRLSDAPESPLTPVPLPAPSLPHNTKHEPRSSGTLVSHWATRAGIKLLDLKPTPPGPAGNASEDERNKRGSKGRRSGQNLGSGDSGKGLVERSPAVLAMMEMVSQPSKVVRVLARGEKLDPDP